jgi:hypothetical protein
MFMNTLTIENKKYVVLSQKEYEDLRMKAVSKAIPAKKLSLKEGKKLAYNMIDKWAKGK